MSHWTVVELWLNVNISFLEFSLIYFYVSVLYKCAYVGRTNLCAVTYIDALSYLWQTNDYKKLYSSLFGLQDFRLK